MMKPRVLYFAVFVYFALSGGRFTATFLEHELQFTENWMVSGAMAVQLLSSSLCSSWLGGVADSWERSKGGGNRGRLLVMSLGLLLSTTAMLLQSLGSLWLHWDTIKRQQNDTVTNSVLNFAEIERDNQLPNDPIPRLLLAYYLFLRALFAIGTAGMSSVLDGLTLSQLDREGRDKHEYGKERLYGAISWGIANIILGPAVDLFGFKTLYASTILSFIGCMITFYLYAKSISANEYIVDIEIENGCDFAEEKKADDEAMDQLQKNNETDQQKPNYGGNGLFVDESNDTTNNKSNHDRLTVGHIARLISEQSPILNISYLICLFALYIGMSVVESLVFLYFEFLGGSNTMCGLTVAVTVMFELPLFHYAPEVLKILGSPISMLQWGCLAYVVRVLGYSVVPSSHPYWVLLLEPMHGITIAFALTSSVAIADTWMPKGYESSGQGMLSMVRSLGQFVGFCIAGGLEGRTLYRVLATVVTVGSFILGIGDYLSKTKPRAKYDMLT